MRLGFPDNVSGDILIWDAKETFKSTLHENDHDCSVNSSLKKRFSTARSGALCSVDTSHEIIKSTYQDLR